MGYKNTAGNSSIANEFGQWRYFTSATQKLGTYKGAQVNLPIPKADIPEKVNWFAVASSTALKGMGIYEAYRDREYKRAEEYLNTHSLQDYKNQMVNGEIPFQYDYLAMSKLKQGIGENIFQLAAQDFKTDVDRNKYRGMSPEEVDAAFYGHLQESIKEFDDGSLGFNTDDYYFNQGVYAKANKTRMGMLLEHAKVEDNYLQQQFEQNTMAKVKAMANDPAMSIEDIQTGINDILNTSYRMSPEDQYRYLKTFLNELGNNPNGDTILENIAEMPVSDGVTLRQYMGEDEYQQARIKAESFRFNTDAQYRMKFQQNVDKLVREGNVVAIQSALNKHIKANGNVQDAEYEYMLRSLNQARTVQEANTRAALKNGMKVHAITEWQQYFRDMADGKPIPTYEMKKQELEGRFGSGSSNSNDLKVIQQQICYDLIQEGDVDKLNTFMNVLTKSTTTSEFGKAFTGVIKDTLTDLNAVISTMTKEGGAPDPEQLERARSQFLAIHQLQAKNPAAFATLIGKNNPELLDTLRRMNAAQNRGADPIKTESTYRARMAALNNLDLAGNEDRNREINSFQVKLQDIEDNFGQVVNISQLSFAGGVLGEEIKNRAAQLLIADSDLSASDALSDAQEQVFSEYAMVEGTNIIMPRNTLKAQIPTLYIQTLDDETFMAYAESTLKDICRQNGFTKDSDREGSYVSTDKNGNFQVVICDSLGNIRGYVPFSAWAKNIEELADTSFSSNLTNYHNEVTQENYEEQVETDVILHGGIQPVNWNTSK